MVFRDIDKKALIDNAATVVSKITIVGTDIVFTENDYISEWEYEDFRYVPENGFIGQFVERLFDGKLKDLPTDINIENKEINLQVGIVNGITGETTYYDYGNFIVTKPGEEDTTGITSFESADYAKKFNATYTDNINYPCLALELANNVCNQANVPLDVKGNAYCFAVKNEGLVAGEYSFLINGLYYNFSTTKDLKLYDSLLFILDENRIIQKNVNDDFTLTRIDIKPTSSSSMSGTLLKGSLVGYNDFINNDFVIENNQFEETDTLRDVMKAIAKLGYTWVRVGTDNKVHLDFKKKTTSTYGLTIEGKSVQDGTPTPDAPVEIESVEGVTNLANINDIQVGKQWNDMTNTTRASIVFIPVKPNTQYTLSGDISSNSNLTTLRFVETNANKDTAIVVHNIGTYTTSSSTAYISIEILSSTTITSEMLKDVWISLVKGNNAPNIPYGRWLEQKTTGKNLFNLEEYPFIMGIAYNGTGTTQYWSGYCGIRKYFPVEENTTYTFSNNLNKNIYYGLEYYDENESLLSYQLTGGIKTFTTPENCKYIRFATNSSELPTWVQIEKGSTTTPYEPYKENTALIDLNIYDEEGNITGHYELCAIGDVKDTFKDGALTQRIGKVVLDGSDDEAWSISASGNFKRFNISIYNIKLFADELRHLDIISSHFKISDVNDYGICFHYKTQLIFYPQESITTLEQWKTWLSENPVEVYYRLATPIEYNLNYEKLSLFDSVNNISFNDDIIDDSDYILFEDNITIDDYYETEKQHNTYGPVNKVLLGMSQIDGENVYNAKLADEVESIDIEGKSEQDGTPTPDAPIEMKSVEGVTNLFNKNSFNKFTHELQYIFLTLEPNTQYTFSTTMKEVTNIGDNIFFINNGEDAGSSLNGVNVNKSRTITTDSTGKVKIGYRDYDNLLTDEIENYEYQLEKGSVKHSHVPYGRWLEQRTAGKNRLNTPYTKDNKLTMTATRNDHYINSDYYAYLEAGKTYTFSCKTSTTYGYSGGTECYLLLNKEYTTIIHMDNNTGFTFTPKISGRYYLRYDVNVAGETQSFWDFQIEEGSTATEFVLYNEDNTALIDLNIYDEEGNITDYYRLASIGDVKDTFKDGILSPKIAKITLNGTESYDYSPVNGFNRFILSADIVVGRANSTALSPHFVGGRTDSKYNEIYLGGSGRIAILYNATSVDEFKAWLSENPVDVYYIISTPKQKSYNINYEKLKLHKGYNKITLNDDLEPNMNIIVSDIDDKLTTYSGNPILANLSDNRETSIQIWDNPLTYTENLRKIALNGSESLFGIRYTPMNTNTVGHPWLEGDDYVKLTNLSEQTVYTYPFDRKLSYRGYIKSDISSTALTSVQQEYEFNGDIDNRLSKTEISVDKANKKITALASEVTDNTSKIASLTITTDNIKTEVSEKVSTSELNTAIKNIEVGGRNLLALSDILYEKTNTSYSGTYGVNVVDSFDLNTLIGKKVTFSFFINVTGDRKQNTSYGSDMQNRFGMHATLTWAKADGTTTPQYIFAEHLYDTEVIDDRVVMTTTINPPSSAYVSLTKFAIAMQMVALPADTNTATWKLGYPKLEIGNKATDWSPAPEDYSTTTEMNSAIEQSASAIEMSVSNLSTDLTNATTEIKESLANYATENEVVQLRQEVKTNQTNTSLQINVINEALTNGVSKVKTEKGFTFDDSGLTIDDSNSDIASNLDNEGLQIYDKTGSTESELLYAGIDNTTNEAVVRTKNLSVSQYFVMGEYSRFEDFEDEDGEEGTGVFFIG